MTLVDSHCHLDFDHFYVDRAAVLNRAWEAGLDRILVPGIDITTSLAALKLADSHPQIFAAVGIHPNGANLWTDGSVASLKTVAQRPKVVAIGEIGLDYYRQRAPRTLQQQVFTTQLEIANSLRLPVIIHTSNASNDDRACISDVIAALKDWEHNLAYPGVIHSYSGNLAETEMFLEMGFYLGITGPVTFSSAKELREIVVHIPLNRLLIETDAPYLTPHPFRGKRNEPAYVRLVAEKVGEIKGVDPEIVAEITTANARKLFGWG